jgi:hypothetical protein
MPLLISTKDVGLSPDLRNKLSALGISANSFDDLIELIVEAATKPTETETISIGDLPSEARTFGLGGGSSQAVKLTERTFKFEANDMSLSYDVSNIKKQLPEGVTHVSTNVTLTGKGRSASRASSGSIALPEDVTQGKVDLTFATEYGTLVMTKTFPVGKNQSGSVVLDVDDQSAAPTNLKVSEHLELLSAAVSRLQQK